jgi:hypothetical protein
LPPIKLQRKAGSPETFDYRPDLTDYVDQTVVAFQDSKIREKYNRRVVKAAEKGIVYGAPDFYFNTRKFMIPISQMISTEQGVRVLIAIIKNKVLPTMGKDEKILNTNLPQQVIDEIGPGRFHLVPQTMREQQKRNEGQGKKL